MVMDRVHPMLGGSVWYVPSFSPESAAFRQDVVPFKIPDKVFVEYRDVPG